MKTKRPRDAHQLKRFPFGQEEPMPSSTQIRIEQRKAERKWFGPQHVGDGDTEKEGEGEEKE